MQFMYLHLAVIANRTCDSVGVSNPCGDHTVCLVLSAATVCVCDEIGYEQADNTSCAGMYVVRMVLNIRLHGTPKVLWNIFFNEGIVTGTFESITIH